MHKHDLDVNQSLTFDEFLGVARDQMGLQKGSWRGSIWLKVLQRWTVKGSCPVNSLSKLFLTNRCACTELCNVFCSKPLIELIVENPSTYMHIAVEHIVQCGAAYAAMWRA